MSKRATCSRCGESWDRDPALEVPCPTCSAKIGRRCMRPSEYRVWGGQPHTERDQAALDAGIMPKCSEGPTAKRARQSEFLPNGEIRADELLAGDRGVQGSLLPSAAQTGEGLTVNTLPLFAERDDGLTN